MRSIVYSFLIHLFLKPWLLLFSSMRVKAIFPFTFSIQRENHATSQSQEQELWGTCNILWKVQELLPLKRVVILSRQGRQTLQGPMKGLSHLKPHTSPLPPKWKWLQVWISSKITAEPSSCASEKLGAAAPVEDSPSCELQPGPHTTAGRLQISRPNGEKKRTICSKQHFFFLNKPLLSGEKRQGEPAPAPRSSNQQDLSGNPKDGHPSVPDHVPLHHWHQLVLLPRYNDFLGMWI